MRALSPAGMSRLIASSLVVLALSVALRAQSQSTGSAAGPQRFGVGHPASPADIARRDIGVSPDGTGLPPGSGTVAEGQRIYAARCAACHGPNGKTAPDVLVGAEPRDPMAFSRSTSVPRTIGNYWPYATTVFDYIRRAMPGDAPTTLSNNEVYGVVAYLLFLNEIVPVDTTLDKAALLKIKMPAHDRFVVAPR